MSWICKRCETENPDIMDVCEVCDAQAPRIINLTCDNLLEGSPVNISWKSEYCDKVIISYGGKQVDVTTDSGYEIMNPEEKDVVFLVSNEDITTRTICFHLEFLEKPIIDFVSDKYKIRKGKNDSVVLSWNIKNYMSARFIESGCIFDVSNIGEKMVSPINDTIYELEVVALDGKTTFHKDLEIRVFDECEIVFNADKQYVFPTIPVVLTWEVKHSKKVWLDSDEVEAIGSKVIEPKKAAIYILSVEDEFGIKEKKVNIQMLPIPQVKSIMAPVPNFLSNLAVTIQQPRYNVEAKIPQIDVGLINVEVPKVKSLTDLGLTVELSPPLPKYNLISSIKRVFNYLIRKE